MPRSGEWCVRRTGALGRSWRSIRGVLGSLCLTLGLIGAAVAADVSRPAPASLPARVVTHHTITLAGRQIDYEADSELLPVTDESGKASGMIDAISYVAHVSGTPRPVSFVFNGGPGAASVFLHLGALGPRIVVTPPSGAGPGVRVDLADNPDSWLAFTDLVFIDPVGTGFSRGEGKGPNPDKPFWNVNSDITSLGTAVRLWLSRHERWNSPVFYVGESYGGFRAAVMGRDLAEQIGVTPSGLVLISPALDLALLHGGGHDLLPTAFELPTYAAVAAAFGGPPRDLPTIERFALGEYLVGLAAIKGQPSPQDPFIARLAGITGIPAEVVSRYRGRIPPQVFARDIQRAKNEVVSLYDGTVARPAGTAGDHGGDPVLGPAVAAYAAGFNRYAEEALGIHTDRRYRVLPHAISRQWDWQEDRGGPGLGRAMGALEAVLQQYPATRVMIVNGRYDLVTPYLASRWLADQIVVPPAVRERIRLYVYPGGHMMYMRPDGRAALAHDAAEIYAAALAMPAQ
jgi:carboxypeptidase C (cathepsin A)